MVSIAILVFEEFDLLDVGGPYEVFLTAGRLREREGLPADIAVELVSPAGRDVTAYGGMQVTGLRDVATIEAVDCAVIPGLIALGKIRQNAEVGAAVSHLLGRASLAASVCTGSFLLADAGALKALPATTHWEDIPELANASVGEVVSGVRWVDAGNVVTSGGLTSGIHMALHLVARWFDEALAVRTAKQLELEWSPVPDRN